MNISFSVYYSDARAMLSIWVLGYLNPKLAQMLVGVWKIGWKKQSSVWQCVWLCSELSATVIQAQLESSQSPQTSANAMLFARWQHHIRFGSGYPYAPSKAMLTKISKWSRIQDSFRITHKIESLVVFAIPNIPRKFQKDLSITFRVILLTHRQTDKQTMSGKNITSLAELIIEFLETGNFQQNLQLNEAVFFYFQQGNFIGG